MIAAARRRAPLLVAVGPGAPPSVTVRRDRSLCAAFVAPVPAMCGAGQSAAPPPVIDGPVLAPGVLTAASSQSGPVGRRIGSARCTSRKEESEIWICFANI